MATNNAINSQIPIQVSLGGTGATSFSAGSLLLGSGSSAFGTLGVATNGQIPIGVTGSNPVLATITAGTGIVVTNGSGSITISNASTITWSTVTGTSQSMATNNGYVANNAGQVVFTLPSTANLGDIITVIGINNATGWKIAQNSSQQIMLGDVNTTAGTGGFLSSTAIGDRVTLTCVVAGSSTTYSATSMGNITVV